MTEAEKIARSYFIAMCEEQDWISLPTGCALDGDELRALAVRMATSVTKSHVMLGVLNGPGNGTVKLRQLLARTWAAGYKAGSATGVPRETSQEETP